MINICCVYIKILNYVIIIVNKSVWERTLLDAPGPSRTLSS